MRTSAWSKAGTLSVEKGLTDSSQGSVEGSGRTPPVDTGVARDLWRDPDALLLGTTGVAKEVDTLLRS